MIWKIVILYHFGSLSAATILSRYLCCSSTSCLTFSNHASLLSAILWLYVNLEGLQALPASPYRLPPGSSRACIRYRSGPFQRKGILSCVILLIVLYLIVGPQYWNMHAWCRVFHMFHLIPGPRCRVRTILSRLAGKPWLKTPSDPALTTHQAWACHAPTNL